MPGRSPDKESSRKAVLSVDAWAKEAIPSPLVSHAASDSTIRSPYSRVSQYVDRDSIGSAYTFQQLRGTRTARLDACTGLYCFCRALPRIPHCVREARHQDASPMMGTSHHI